jgi:predicted nucleic acid-binding protein
VPFDVLARRAWNLRDNLTTYDACYAAAAEQFELRLVTLDARLAGAPDVRCEVLVGPSAPG